MWHQPPRCAKPEAKPATAPIPKKTIKILRPMSVLLSAVRHAPRARLDQIGELLALTLVERGVDLLDGANAGRAQLLDHFVVLLEHAVELSLVELCSPDGLGDVFASAARLAS